MKYLQGKNNSLFFYLLFFYLQHYIFIISESNMAVHKIVILYFPKLLKFPCPSSYSSVTLFSGGSRISPWWRCQPYRGHQHTILLNFPQNCYEIERIWTPRGTCVTHTPLRSTNAIIGQKPKATTKVTLTNHPVVI